MVGHGGLSSQSLSFRQRANGSGVNNATETATICCKPGKRQRRATPEPGDICPATNGIQRLIKIGSIELPMSGIPVENDSARENASNFSTNDTETAIFQLQPSQLFPAFRPTLSSASENASVTLLIYSAPITKRAFNRSQCAAARKVNASFRERIFLIPRREGNRQPPFINSWILINRGRYTVNHVFHRARMVASGTYVEINLLPGCSTFQLGGSRRGWIVSENRILRTWICVPVEMKECLFRWFHNYLRHPNFRPGVSSIYEGKIVWRKTWKMNFSCVKLWLYDSTPRVVSIPVLSKIQGTKHWGE